LIITFGATFKRKVFSKTGDYSYGLYIYAFPVQQTLVHFYREDMNVYIFFVASFVITFILSILSWHLFEKKILNLKHKRKNLHA
ncbi:MAG: acyltransferase, partial [Epsilonproteobacteria bacterium]|nr:acyltransferase [Campylobacterota bacterium]